jgi:hypothetical protein
MPRSKGHLSRRYDCSPAGCETVSEGAVPTRWTAKKANEMTGHYICVTCLTEPGDARLRNYSGEANAFTLCSHDDHAHFVGLKHIKSNNCAWDKMQGEQSLFEWLMDTQQSR